ncbi:MAG: hypothetical protein ACN6NW_11570 [Acinetobacter amyesii]|uniref:hypothetical protein n=1 Tax=Acinetobacter gandensis TaxID=1443941 RepID=UPI003CFED3A0
MIVAATRTYSQNKQAEAEAQKQATEQQALEKLQAEGGEKWAEYNSTKDYVTKQNLLKNALPAYKEASDQAQTWGMGGDSSRALNAVTTAITAALGGQTDLQVVSNTLAPYAVQIIGQEFGHGNDATVIEVSKDTHKAGRTHSGKILLLKSRKIHRIYVKLKNVI